MQQMNLPFLRIHTVLIGGLGVGLLSLTALHSYLLFHTLAETFSIVISCGIFIVAWHTRKIADNSLLLFLGTAYLFVGLIDYLHTMAYPGMQVFSDMEGHYGVQLWIAARYLESGALLVSPLFLTRRIRSGIVFGIFTAITALILVSIFMLDMFPRCYIEGQGLTVFKIVSEVIISGMFIVSALVWYLHRKKVETEVMWYLIAAACISATSEILFSAYTDVFGVLNFAGHVLKIASFFVVYRAVIAVQLERPFATIFRALKGREADLKITKGSLEKEIREKDRELQYRQQALEEIYAIATMQHHTLQKLNDRLAQSIARILGTPLVVLYQLQKEKIGIISRVVHNELVDPRGLEVPCPVCKAMLKKGTPVVHHGDLRHNYSDYPCFKKGEFKSYLGVPIINRNGERMGAVCILDTAQREFRENEIHLVDIFSRYIAEEINRKNLEYELRSAKEIRLLGQLTSGVAHEVRNPLNALATVSDAFAKKIGDDEEYKPYIEHIKKQVERLSLLMEDLLAFGRPVRRADFTRIAVGDLVEEALENWRQSAEIGERDVVFHTPHWKEIGKWTVRVDEARMQQVITNILDNAIHHTAEDGHIEITLQQVTDGYVEIRIRDDGTGISREAEDKLFSPFYSTRAAGTGLGLSIVKSKVENHGGSVRIFNNDSAPGATVVVELPLASPQG